MKLPRLVNLVTLAVLPAAASGLVLLLLTDGQHLHASEGHAGAAAILASDCASRETGIMDTRFPAGMPTLNLTPGSAPDPQRSAALRRAAAHGWPEVAECPITQGMMFATAAESPPQNGSLSAATPGRPMQAPSAPAAAPIWPARASSAPSMAHFFPLALVVAIAAGLAVLQASRALRAHLARKSRVSGAPALELPAHRAEVDALKQTLRCNANTLSMISHEMRTLVIGTRGMLDSLDATVSDAAHRERISIARTAMAGLLRHLDDIADLRHVQNGGARLRLAPFRPTELLAGLAQLAEPMAAQRGNRIETDLPVNPPDLIGDGTRIGQIVLNLLSNAAKFSSDDVILLRATLGVSATQTVPLAISVSDTGPGIAAADHDRIFERFVRLDRDDDGSAAGLGIGLAVCRELAVTMGGTIVVDSGYGSGSTFTVTIPLQRAPATGASGQMHDQPLAGIRVMLIDDNPLMLEIDAAHLTHAGAVVAKFLSADAALDAMQREHPHVILLDQVMPDVDSVEVLAAIRAIPGAESIPVIAYSAHLAPAQVAACRDAGFHSAELKGSDIAMTLARAVGAQHPGAASPRFKDISPRP